MDASTGNYVRYFAIMLCIKYGQDIYCGEYDTVFQNKVVID